MSAYSLEIEGLVRRKQELEAEIERLQALVAELDDPDYLKEMKIQNAELRAEVERLKAEKHQLLMWNEVFQEALDAIAAWSRAYPLSVFPEPDLVKARALLEAGGMTLDAVSANAMRHVVTQVGKIARDAVEQSTEST